MTASKKNAEYDRSRMAQEYGQMQKDCFNYKSTAEGLKKIKGELEAEIISLDDKVNSLRLQILEKDRAIANLQTQLEQALQPNLPLIKPEPVNPEPEGTEPDTTEALQTEAQTTEEPETVDDSELTVIVDATGLIKYIRDNFPDSGVEYKKIKDSIRNRHQKAKNSDFSRLANYEQKYGFKYSGKIGNNHQYKIPKV